MADLESKRVALITGGASGFGLATATALLNSTTAKWHIHILDYSTVNIDKAKSTLVAYISFLSFHHTDVTDYASISAAFDQAFRTSGRLDFVFANAGVVERFNYYGDHTESAGPPPQLDTTMMEVNLKAIYYTAYLALHYFRLSTRAGFNDDKSLVMTSSSAGLYPTTVAAMYAGTKHGVLGFMRSIAPRYLEEGIRCNAVCPGMVRTGIVESAVWDMFDPDRMTSINCIVDAVMAMVSGNELVAENGKVKKDELYGQAVECSKEKWYLRYGEKFSDATMRAIHLSDPAANHLEYLEKTQNE